MRFHEVPDRKLSTLKVSPFVIHANLDCEARWAGGGLPGKVSTRVSYYAALTAALAPEGAEVEVWVPAAIDGTRLAFPVAMRVGAPPRADLVWAASDAKAANDRRLARTLAAEHELGVPGARVITSVGELDLVGPWVAKAPWTTAGRDRCHGDGPPSDELRTRLGRLLARFGALVVEPWLPRVLDIGVCATVHADGTVTAHAPHGLVTDARGTFLGIDLAPPPLTELECARLAAFVAAIGPRLGYVGPVAVDAFVTAERRLCVCEINARYSFGWVARAMQRRHGTARLGFGAPPAGATALIAPGPVDDGVTAWIA